MSNHWKKDDLFKELKFSTSRSGGAGGQHVNKVSSKVELNWDLSQTTIFNQFEIDRIEKFLKKFINKNRQIKMFCETHRSQLKNKEELKNKIVKLLKQALKLPKKRLSTKPTAASVEKRKELKKKISQLKCQRKNKIIKFY